MQDEYITLEDAAQLEGIAYKGMTSRLQRNPVAYETIKVPSAGGKDRVMINVTSLSKSARAAHRAATKIAMSETTPETDTATPWYIDVDLNWYIENNKQQYYEAVELSRHIQDFTRYNADYRTEHATETADKLGISQRTLYRYTETYTEACVWAAKLEHEHGRQFDYFKPLSLCRKPKGSQTFPSLSPAMRALIENIWFERTFASNKGTIEMLYDKFCEICAERGWDNYPSIKTVARYVKHLMDDMKAGNAHYLQVNGIRSFKNAKMIKCKRDASELAVMEFVQGDEHTFDFWVQYTAPNGKISAVRPTLVAWIDTRSRVIMGDVACLNGNTQILKQSVVKMIYGMPGGVPKHLHIDNGKDYTSKENMGQSRKERVMRFMEDDDDFKGFYRSVGIEDVSRSLPYQPWGKGNVERFFSTVCQQFSKWFASYTGTLTTSKTSDKRCKDIGKMLEHGELLSMEEFFAVWETWKDKYHNKPHSGLKDAGEKYIKPIELFNNAENRYIKAVPSREYAAILLLKSDSALVRNQGITKWGKLYTHYELSNYVDQRVSVRWDVDDVTKLYVYDKKERKICEAQSAELMMFAPKVSQPALEEHLRNQKRQIKEAQQNAVYYNTPYEVRCEEQTPAVVGGLSLTLSNKANTTYSPPKVKNGTSYANKTSTETRNKANTDSSFFNNKADEVLKKLASVV